MPTAAPADDAHEEDGDAHDVAAAGVSEALARAGDAAGDGAASRAPTVRTGGPCRPAASGAIDAPRHLIDGDNDGPEVEWSPPGLQTAVPHRHPAAAATAAATAGG